MGIAIVTELTAILLTFVAVNVPLQGPKLTRAESLEHWPEAAIGALVVLLGAVLVFRETRRARRAEPSRVVDAPAPSEERLPRVPRALLPERVPRAGIVAAALVSGATVPLAVLLEASFPLAWICFLAPWLTVAALETKTKLARDTLFASFGLLVILQLLHMVEHSVQVGQLVATDGSLRDSHGIFGQLDFELVHFVTDTTLWITLGLFVVIFKGRNIWLIVAFVAASFHQVEHFYLFYLNHFDNDLYLSGGVAGIMGHHGLIGSPIDRPYLHYTYNFIVFVPMLIAVWDEARRVDRESLRRRLTEKRA